ncbi:Hypothetical predicted protein [Cloeon dipterum]|uniref:Gustatory receptor n=1 Tax=Cloeon dipterum TaxID=197152 RepID=A0A8S1D9F1_9INSE|nr:Hypothetical predicted protein [Cloeon dipterum]
MSRFLFGLLQVFIEIVYIFHSVNQFNVQYESHNFRMTVTAAFAMVNYFIDHLNVLSLIQLSQKIPKCIIFMIENFKFADKKLNFQFRDMWGIYALVTSSIMLAKIAFMIFGAANPRLPLSLSSRFVYCMMFVTEQLVSYVCLETKKRLVLLNELLRSDVEEKNFVRLTNLRAIFAALTDSQSALARLTQRFLLFDLSQAFMLVIVGAMNIYNHCAVADDPTINATWCMTSAVFGLDCAWRICFLAASCGCLQIEVSIFVSFAVYVKQKVDIDLQASKIASSESFRRTVTNMSSFVNRVADLCNTLALIEFCQQMPMVSRVALKSLLTFDAKMKFRPGLRFRALYCFRILLIVAEIAAKSGTQFIFFDMMKISFSLAPRLILIVNIIAENLLVTFNLEAYLRLEVLHKALKKSGPKRIQTLVDAFDAICDLQMHVAKCSGRLLFFDLTQQLFIIFMGILNFISICVQEINPMDVKVCVGNLGYAADCFFRFSLICWSCGSLVSKAEKTADLVSRLFRHGQDHKTTQELQAFLDLALSRKVTFSACGLFNVDLPLLFAAGGAVTSYVFLITQLNLVYFSAIRIYKLSAICLICGKVKTEAAETKNLVARLYRYDLKEETRNEINAFFELTLSHQLKFSASGFMDIDLQLLFQAGGAIVSYVVIILQF